MTFRLKVTLQLAAEQSLAGRKYGMAFAASITPQIFFSQSSLSLSETG
jgi:hypothetical protein